MDFGHEDAADPVADLLRIVGLLSVQPPDWQELLRTDRHRSTLVTFVNPQSLLTARRSPGFLDDLARFDLVLPDSIVLARLASALRREPVARRSFDGNSLAPAVFALCRERSLRVGFVGGQPGVAEAAARVFANAFGLPSGLTAAGFFRDRAHRRDVLRSLADHGLDVVVCGMGTGAQERFLLDLVDEGWTGLGFTCGGYLDQAARAGVRYYPAVVDALHLRAAYRMCRELSS
jgi:UDP-N-acetyl-D-mannosaminuronic acid transferase (WecB/TagA/CpsF family)